MLRRYAPIKPSRGTVIPPDVRAFVMERDQLCVFRQLGIDHPCSGRLFLELDHVRGSGALGKKSPSTPDNLVALCPQAHRMKTDSGRVYRPLLIAYLTERAQRSAVIG